MRVSVATARAGLVETLHVAVAILVGAYLSVEGSHACFREVRNNRAMRFALTSLLIAVAVSLVSAAPAVSYVGPEFSEWEKSSPKVSVGPGGQALVRFAMPRLFGPSWHAYPAISWRQGGASFDSPRSADLPPGLLDFVVDDRGVAVGFLNLVHGDAQPAIVEAPPGGIFGTPQPIGPPENVVAATLAVGREGQAAAAWLTGREVHLAVRRAGGAFGPVVNLGRADELPSLVLRPDMTVSALVTEPLENSADYFAAVLVTVAPDGAVQRRTLERAAAASRLVQGESGDLLAINKNGRWLSAVHLGPDGSPSLPMTVAAGSGVDGVDVLGAVLEPTGRAAVAIANRYALVTSVEIREGDVARGFERTSTTLTPTGVGALPARDARFVANRRGDAVLTWGYPGFLPQAAYRPAGGPIGKPVTLSDTNLAAGVPSAGIDATGAALVAWNETDLRTHRVVTRRLGPAGLGPPEILAQAPAIRPRPRSRDRCRAERSDAIRANRRAVVYWHDRPHAVAVCSLETGSTRVFRDGEQYLDFIGSILIAGRFVAVPGVHTTDADGDDIEDSDGVTGVDVYDVRAGFSLSPLGLGGLGDRSVLGDVVLTSDGAVAVSVCRAPREIIGLRNAARTMRHYCSRPGRRVRIVVAEPGGDSHQIAAGRRIPPRSLAIEGHRIRWRQNGRTRSRIIGSRAP